MRPVTRMARFMLLRGWMMATDALAGRASIRSTEGRAQLPRIRKSGPPPSKTALLVLSGQSRPG